MRTGFKIQRTLNNYLSEEGKVRGIIHFHSDFSYDGYNSIPGIVDFFKTNGYSFVCLTEHDDDFDNEKMDRYINVCRDASDSSFYVVPGLEFRCENRVHILGIDIKKYFKTDDPVDAAKKIREQGGIAIIAHPLKYLNNITDELLSAIDGIEIWNGQKDSKYMPHYKLLAYYRKLKSKYPHIKAFCGPDTHSLNYYFRMDMIVHNFSGDIRYVLEKSKPVMQGEYLTLTVNGEVGLFSVTTLFLMRGFFNIVKCFRGIMIKSDVDN